MNTVEAIVTSAAGFFFALAYYSHRWEQQRRVLQWHYTKQSDGLIIQSEAVREQFFQKAFALRRSIELCSVSAPEGLKTQLDHCLDLTKDFSTFLEQVSDELSVPFLNESLPLALQYLLKRWVSGISDIELTLELPSQWPLQGADKHRLVLWCVSECLLAWQAQLSQTSPKAIQLALYQTDCMAKLQLSFSGRVLQKPNDTPVMSELKNIQQIFQLIMPGRCRVTFKSWALECHFSWSLICTEQVTE